MKRNIFTFADKKVTNNNIMFTIVVFFVILCFIFIHSQIVHAKESISYEKSFQTIEIKEGDTLTSIALTYKKPKQDMNSYIKEVQSINNLKNTTIHTGCYLVVPIYFEQE